VTTYDESKAPLNLACEKGREAVAALLINGRNVNTASVATAAAVPSGGGPKKQKTKKQKKTKKRRPGAGYSAS
jgi:hypothetical protein